MEYFFHNSPVPFIAPHCCLIEEASWHRAQRAWARRGRAQRAWAQWAVIQWIGSMGPCHLGSGPMGPRSRPNGLGLIGPAPMVPSPVVYYLVVCLDKLLFLSTRLEWRYLESYQPTTFELVGWMLDIRCILFQSRPISKKTYFKEGLFQRVVWSPL